VATLNFSSTSSDKKVFTPISAALSNLPNGAGTMIVLHHKVATGAGADYCGLLNSAASAWYHTLSQQFGPTVLIDDDGLTGPVSSTTPTIDSTNWWWYTVDWPAGAAALERFHYRNHTSGGSWTHSNSTGNNGGNRAGPGTGGWFRIGDTDDEATVVGRDIALVAVWAGTRFADGDYGTWTKTSDLYNHALGKPTLLVEGTSTTPVDIGLNPSTYSGANSSGTTLTGGDPPTFTFDGQGSAVAPILGPSFVPVPFMK
jgi:hypothetical protein